MDNNNIPFENNFRYDNPDINNKKSEYNIIKNNNSITFNNIKSKDSDAISSSNNINNINENTQNIKTEIKSNKKSDKSIFNSNRSNYPVTLGTPPPNPEKFNTPLMDNEFNSHINILKAKLSKTRAERRKREEEAVIIQHRLTVLRNKEQAKILQFKNMKGHINKILNNRNKVQENLKIKINERNNYKNRLSSKPKPRKVNYLSEKKRNIKTNNNKNYSNIKNNIKKNVMTSSQNNIHPLKLSNFNFDLEQKSDKIDSNMDNINIDDDKTNVIKSNDYNIKDSIKSFKEKLIRKIKQDEEEKKRIEKEIAKIEEEENKILKIFNKKKLSNDNNII